MPSTQPQVLLIDHSTGKVQIIGQTQSAKDELATALMEQARTVETAAVGTPPRPDSNE